MAFKAAYGGSAEVRRDESKVLGLLAATRVFGKGILPPDPDLEEQYESLPGRWIAAYWDGALHVPCSPLLEARWTKGGTPVLPPSRRPPRIPAVLWWPTRDGVVLQNDRIVRAVRAIQSMEALYVNYSGSVPLLRRARNRLVEAAKAGWTTPSARNALAKAERVFGRAVVDDRLRRRSLLETLRLPAEELRSQADSETKRLALWPYLEDLKTIRRREVDRYYPAGTPIELLEALRSARASRADLEKLLALYTQVLETWPRKDHNPASDLRVMLALDDWSESSAARLWVRATRGADPALERRVAQALHAKYAAALQAMVAREREDR